MVLEKHFVIKVNPNNHTKKNHVDLIIIYYLGTYDVDANLPYHVFKVNLAIYFSYIEEKLLFLVDIFIQCSTKNS
jgi:hypothetical protein